MLLHREKLMQLLPHCILLAAAFIRQATSQLVQPGHKFKGNKIQKLNIFFVLLKFIIASKFTLNEIVIFDSFKPIQEANALTANGLCWVLEHLPY